MTRYYKMIITGPAAYLPELVKIKDIEITQDEIEEAMEEGESEDDAVNYILNDMAAEWEQRWCQAIVITVEQYIKLKEEL